MNIQHTRHTISANTIIPTMNDKHPPLIIAFYYKYNNFFLKIQIFCNIFCAVRFYSKSAVRLIAINIRTFIIFIVQY
jgi:hypothetical protein